VQIETQKRSGRGPNNSLEASKELLGPLPELLCTKVCMHIETQKSAGRGPNNSLEVSKELLGPLPELFHTKMRMHIDTHLQIRGKTVVMGMAVRQAITTKPTRGFKPESATDDCCVETRKPGEVAGCSRPVLQ
jgi:hypothetical protein